MDEESKYNNITKNNSELFHDLSQKEINDSKKSFVGTKLYDSNEINISGK